MRFTSTEDRPTNGLSASGSDILVGLPLVRWAQLGALALLAEHVPADAAGRNPDVAIIDALARERGGRETLATLHALAATGSIRQAAVRVHTHHSTVAARLTRVQAALDFPLDTAAGRLRLCTALLLRRLRDNAT